MISLVCAQNCTRLVRGCIWNGWAIIAPNELRHIKLNGHSANYSSAASSSPSVDPDEIDRFNRNAHLWWSGQPGLHTLNRLRVPLVRDALVRQRAALEGKPVEDASTTPLRGFNVLDVGCGGGILSEPLARLGANVTGLDASSEAIAVASWHSKLDPAIASRINYVCTTVEDIETEQRDKYDGVVASEIIEHIADKTSFVNACCSLVKPGGSIFFTTINKTYLSFGLGILAAEQLLRIVPVGTHDWTNFVDPKFLEGLLLQNKFSVRLMHGMALNPLTMRWMWIRDRSVCYAMHAVKPTSQEPTEHDIKHATGRSVKSSDRK